jgi:hypothetical protein
MEGEFFLCARMATLPSDLVARGVLVEVHTDTGHCMHAVSDVSISLGMHAGRGDRTCVCHECSGIVTLPRKVMPLPFGVIRSAGTHAIQCVLCS